MNVTITKKYINLTCISVICILFSCKSKPVNNFISNNTDATKQLLLDCELLSLTDDYQVLKHDFTNQVFKKSTLTKVHNPILFFRYDYTACNSCTDIIIAAIKEAHIENRVNTLINFDEKRQYIAWKANTNMENTYWLKRGELNIKSEFSGNSFLFLFHPETNTISHVFTPIKNLPTRTSNYLKIVNSLINSTSK